MATPFRRTADGLESQMATNHFGPFLLTGLLLDQLVASGEGRVVTLSSQAHRLARSAPLGDPRARRRYSRWGVYGQTKLANLLFAFELDRRLRRAGLPALSLAAHPGLAGTHLAVNGQLGGTEGRRAAILDAAVKAISQSAAAGAWPGLMAATADLPGGTYVGPGGPGQASGRPRVVDTAPLARDEMAQRRLWELSEATVGLSWP
jgi:NAD(P)-dependent dehydrogenase (short-subunit alcohol dehydrogenase family)